MIEMPIAINGNNNPHKTSDEMCHSSVSSVSGIKELTGKVVELVASPADLPLVTGLDPEHA